MNIREIMNLVEGWNPPEDEIDLYMYGCCHSLALAVNKLTGLPLVGLFEYDGYQDKLVHVMNSAGRDQFVDIYGVRSSAEVVSNLKTEHGMRDAERWQWRHISPQEIKAAIRDGTLDASTPRSRSEALKVAKALVMACGLGPTPSAS